MKYPPCYAEDLSPISRLPPELLVLIFEEVFGTNRPDKLPILFTWRYKEKPDGSKELGVGWTAPVWVGNVFDVCRLWRIEASQIFFGKNYFLLGLHRSRCVYQGDLNVDLGTQAFARQIGHQNLHLVTSMAVKVSSHELLGKRKWVQQGVWYNGRPGRSWMDRVLGWIKDFPGLRQFRVVCADLGCVNAKSFLWTVGKPSLSRQEVRRVLEDVVVLIEYKCLSQHQIQDRLRYGPLPRGRPSTYRLVWKDTGVVVEPYKQSSWRSLYLHNDRLRQEITEDDYPHVAKRIREDTEFYYAE
ncbi:MAG: hypothetical protein LQ350_005809 [Teloschistes chrysophthalmus]|nr:MAG: hypothetical protein LQ350_005809 [Niorma chrysophthalma]